MKIKIFSLILFNILGLTLNSTDFELKTNAPKELCDSIQAVFKNSEKSSIQASNELSLYLKDKNIDLNIRDKNNNTAMHFAAQQGYNDVIKLLIKSGARIDPIARETIMPDWDQIKNNGTIRLKYPELKEGDFDKLEGFFISKYIIQRYRSKQNKRQACKFKNLFNDNQAKNYFAPEPFTKKDIIQLKIKNYTPLHDAICNGFYDTVKLLITLGADVNQPIEHEFTIVLPKKKKKEKDGQEPDNEPSSKIIRIIINPKTIAKNLGHSDIERLIEANNGHDYMSSKIENNNLVKNI